MAPAEPGSTVESPDPVWEVPAVTRLDLELLVIDESPAIDYLKMLAGWHL
ncbi:hypothetical protein [Actinoplanes sp. NPDC026670]